MSHFTVLVVTDTPECVEKALQPYHEYECTGIEDAYVRFVEAEESLEELTTDHKKHLKEYPDSTPEDFGQFLDDWHGYHKKDGKWGRVTNPDAKWDWWLVGGRWSGFFKLNEGANGNSGQKPLIMGGGESNGIDQARKRDIDFETMMKDAGEKGTVEYDKAAKIINGRNLITWEAMREGTKDIDDAREKYHAQQVLKDLKEVWSNPFFEIKDFFQDRETYIQNKKIDAVSTFAILKDGQWMERGSMGWWGCVSDEKDNWSDNYLDIINSIPDDKYLTVVDCHI